MFYSLCRVVCLFVSAINICCCVSDWRGVAVFDIPVYWPILLMYFLILFVLTMKKEMTKWYQMG